MKDLEISRRTWLRVMALGGAGLMVGCQTRSEAGEVDSLEPTAVAMSTKTPEVNPPPIVATLVPRVEEMPVFVEEDLVARSFEKLLWRLSADKNLLFRALEIEEGDEQWQVTGKEEELLFSNLDFRVANVESRQDVDGSVVYSGFVSGVTGDKCIYIVDLARKKGPDEWEFFVESTQEYQSVEGGILASYLYIDGKESYLNKQRNMAQTAWFLASSMMKEPIKAGGEFSLLDRVNAKYNFGFDNLYQLGWAKDEIDRLVQAGEAGEIATPLIRMFAQAARLGLGSVTQATSAEYPDLPYGGEEDSFNATSFFDPYNPKEIQDFKWVNESGQDLWVIPKLSFYQLRDFPKWWSGVTRPSPIRMGLSVSLSKIPPKEDDLVLIGQQINWFREYDKTRPNAVEIDQEVAVNSEVGQAYYDATKVGRMYVLDGGGRIEDLVVDQQIMEVVKGLKIRVGGDISNFLIRAIPPDNAKAISEVYFPDSIGLKFSDEYYPHWPMITAQEMGIRWYMGREKTFLDLSAARSLLALQEEAFSLGLPAYLAYGYRDYVLQWLMNKAANGRGAATPGGSEHVTGLAVDLYADFSTIREHEYRFEALVNKYGWVHSLSWEDWPHIFYLDGVYLGLTKALLDAKIDPNNRHNSVHARLAVFQVCASQAEAIYY